MILGIVKNKKQILGKCCIKECYISYNKTFSVVCDNEVAISKDNIICQCDNCGKQFEILKRNFFYKKMENLQLCTQCKISLLTELKYKRSVYLKNRWKNDKNFVSAVSNAMKKQWTQERRNNHSIKIKERFKNTEYKKHHSDLMKQRWQSQEYRNKMAKIGVRISKFQKNVYDHYYLSDNNWIMEYSVPNSSFTVDMYNPKLNKIIECYGDYWHCNPKIFDEKFYHKRKHKTAKEIWEHDKLRIKLLKKMKFKVQIIWESDWKQKAA